MLKLAFWSVILLLLQGIHESAHLVHADDSGGGGGDQRVPVDAGVGYGASVEHGFGLTRVPDEGGEGGVGVAEGGLTEEVEAVIF